MENKTTKYSNEEFQQLIYDSSSYTELARKIGYKTKSGAIIHLIQREIAERNLETKFAFHTLVKRNEENIFVEDSTADQRTLVRWYLKGNYTPYECALCGQPPEWCGQPLTLRLDHINGHNKDDRLENLRWICPNCDSQLSTYGARNIGNV